MSEWITFIEFWEWLTKPQKMLMHTATKNRGRSLPSLGLLEVKRELYNRSL